MSMYRRAWLMSIAIFALLNPIFAQSTAADELRRADKQFELFAYNLAQKSYETVVKTEPYNTHALSRLAECYTQLNQPDEALPWYDRATAQEDVKHEVLLNYGKALLSSGNYAAAKKWFIFYAQYDKEVGKHYSEMCEYALSNANKEALYTAKDEPTSSPASEFSAAFYGNKIVFSSSRTDISRKSKSQTETDWSGSTYNQLFVSQTDKNDFLQKPTFLKSDLGKANNEGPVSFSADGKRVAFCKNNFINGTRQIATSSSNMSLYVADVADGNWFNIKAFPYNGSDYATGFPSLSSDGNTMYFASNRPEGNGGWDIYSTNWNGKSWSTPENLGNAINSQGNEITPYFDGKNLFFASDWHFGLGGFDVFRAESEKGDWMKIFHLGPGINSKRDDYGFIFNSNDNIGYLTSNRPEGKGNEDLWRIQKKTDDFVISVLDVNKKPISGAKIDFSNCKSGEFTTDASGKYAFSVSAGQANCKASVRKKGYKDAEISVLSNGSKAISVLMEADLVAVFLGKVQDLTTKTALEDVLVRALPVPKGDVITASTGKDGKYSLPLEAKKVYKIQYSKSTYNDIFITLETGDAKSSNDISEVLLQSSKPVEKPKKDEIKPTTASTDNPKTDEIPVEYGVVKPPKKSDIKEKIEVAETFISGYAVQLASVPGKADAATLSKYDALKSLGNVYTQQSGKSTKIRLGVYNKREDADQVAKKANQMQYKSAFVVEEKSVNEKLVYAPKPIEKPIESGKSSEIVDKIKTTKPTEKDNKPADKSKTTAKSAVMYAVQVASMKEDDTVNLAPYMKITEFGNVYTRPENKLTKIRVGVWETNDEAEAAQEEIVKKGFNDAVVVTEKSAESIKRFLIKSKTPIKINTTVKPNSDKKLVPKGEIAPPEPASIKEPESGKASATPVVKSSNFRVRLISLAAAENFDESKITGMSGKLEQRKEGKLTVFFMNGYPDLEAAKKDKAKALANGFHGVHVVKEIKGKLMKVAG